MSPDHVYRWLLPHSDTKTLHATGVGGRLSLICKVLGARGSIPGFSKPVARAILRELRKKLENGEELTLEFVTSMIALHYSPASFDNPALHPRFARSAAFLSSWQWRKVRINVLLEQPYCGACGAKATEESPLHVDHILPRSIYPELALSHWNLQTLCLDCNFGKANTLVADFRESDKHKSELGRARSSEKALTVARAREEG